MKKTQRTKAVSLLGAAGPPQGQREVKIRVYHSYYGCDTGCCGHVVEVDGKREFEFEHPSDEDLKDPKAWAREFATRVLTRTNPSCLSTIDWDSLELVDDHGYGEPVDSIRC